MTHSPQNTGTLNLEGVSIKRGDNLLIEGLSFSLAPGALLWITGDNGIGKTSLLKCIAGFLAPCRGRVLWNDENLHDNPTTPIAYQGHFDAHKPSLSVEENLQFWHKLYASDVEVAYAIKQVGLSEQTKLKAKNLSAGQSRRLSLARLCLKDAPLWILDEPMAAMDKPGNDMINALLAKHLDNKGSILLASHAQPSTMSKDTRILALSRNSDIDV